jgi:PAB1-binding protein PBP1
MHEKVLNKGEGPSAVFRTDAAISGSRYQTERTLKAWVPDESIETDMSLESSRNKSSTGGAWNQFEVNERLFGLTTDYDENIYTTTIDKSHPDYIKRYAEADRKAREIEGSVANNSHVAEERIVDNLAVDDSGVTEEDK